MPKLPSFARFRRDTSGAVAVEFVLIAPLLLSLLFGVTCVGYFMGISHSVSQLAAGAARASVAGLDTQERQDIAQSYVDAAGTRYPLLVQDAVSPTISAEQGLTPGMTVSVSYSLDGSLLQIANSLLGMDIQRIERTAYVAY